MGDHQHDSYDVYGVAQEHHSHHDLDSRIDDIRSDLNGNHDDTCARLDELERQVGLLIAALQGLTSAVGMLAEHV